MKRLISMVLAVLLIMSLPMTALAEAIKADTSYGDVKIGDTHVEHTDANGSRNDAHEGAVDIIHTDGGESGTVSVNMSSGSVTVNGDVTGGIQASGDANIVVNGNVSNNDGDGISITGGSVTVTGNVSGGDSYQDRVGGGSGVNIRGGEVTVNGNVSGGNATEYIGGDGVKAYGGSVTVNNGGVTGGHTEGDARGGDGVYLASGSVTVSNGDVTGGSSQRGDGGYGVFAFGGSISVNGDVTGGVSGGDEAWGARGVELQNDASASVTGEISGGEGYYGGLGASVSDETELKAGSITGGTGEAYGGNGLEATGAFTVSGNVTGGDAVGENGVGGDAIRDLGGNVKVEGKAVGGSAAKGQGGSGIIVYPENSGSVYLEGDALGGTGTGGIQAPGIVVIPAMEGESYSGISVNDTNEVKAEPSIPGYTEELTQEKLQSFITLRNGSWPSEGVGAPGTVPSAPSQVPEYAEEAPARSSGVSTSGYSRGALWSKGYIQRTLFKIENGAGMKPAWEEVLEDGILTITAENEPVVFTTWLEGMKELNKRGIDTIVIKTANCETELVLAELIALNGTEYILTQEGETASLMMDGGTVEI